jgi:hypothetical protein
MNDEQAKEAFSEGKDVLMSLFWGQGTFRFGVVFVVDQSELACFDEVAAGLAETCDTYKWSLA